MIKYGSKVQRKIFVLGYNDVRFVIFTAYQTNPRKHLATMIYTNSMSFPRRVSNTFLGYHRSCLYFNMVK